MDKSRTAALTTNQAMEMIKRNQGNTQFQDLLFMAMYTADEWTYNLNEPGYKYDPSLPQFVCVDYVSFLTLLINEVYPELEEKEFIRVDNDHIWMYFAIPCVDRFGNKKEGIWVDPTWFDNGYAYNFNHFCPSNFDELPTEWRVAPLDCHGKPISSLKKLSQLTRLYVPEIGTIAYCPGFTYSVYYDFDTGRYHSIEYNFGRGE